MTETVRTSSAHTMTLASSYVIVRREITCPELLRVSLESGEEVLPVFSSEEAARRFLISYSHGEEVWRVRECSAGELTSLLLGPCMDVEHVLLNPLQEPFTVEDALVKPIHRESFVASLLSSRA
jgi:hypothetical protein